MLKNIVSFFLCMLLLSQTARAEGLPDFAQIAKENADAVVAITVSLKQAANRPAEQWMPEHKSSIGSGFVISEEGYILTNAHVVQDGSQFLVKFKDKRTLPAILIGADRASDLALLKVNAAGLTKVKIGSVTTLESGEWVMAIGAPFGFEQSVTKGIVSAKERVVSRDVYVPFIQTDVPINPGNSGGPLFDSRGMVVGVNSWIFTKTEGYQGLSFAIPIDLAMNVVNQLKNKGKVLRGWLGVKALDVTSELAQSFAMPKAYGALISEIAPTSPAQKAGLMVGDIVIGLNDQNIETAAELPAKIAKLAAGSLANLEIIRQGEKKIVEVRVVSLP